MFAYFRPSYFCQFYSIGEINSNTPLSFPFPPPFSHPTSSPGQILAPLVTLAKRIVVRLSSFKTDLLSDAPLRAKVGVDLLVLSPPFRVYDIFLQLSCCIAVLVPSVDAIELTKLVEPFYFAIELTKLVEPFYLAEKKCSAFLDWNESDQNAIHDMAVIFRSFVATLKLHPALDASLEEKAVKFLDFATPTSPQSADAFVGSLAAPSDDSLTHFIQCIVVLISSASMRIITATVEILDYLITNCSLKVRLTLLKAGLIPQLITTLNPYCLSFAEAVDIHFYLLTIIKWSIWLATPDALTVFGIKDGHEQQAVHKTVFQQVLVPSEKYICHLCVNRFSIVDGEQSQDFLIFIVRILVQCPYYLPTMDLILHMPVIPAIPSCLTFFEEEDLI
ncbi:hypothetical protein BLNAU_21861 [Blattamonas nauphoetae]|uniref:Uncharacterized protein n=1 Tax=Blattamonas nauphoetae TaxID=2049346 RepID=A0ABQ9WUS2_9EUKA|nr:hypothetical protein BLNAU_21861 [Blattamonas nauphoetae]